MTSERYADLHMHTTASDGTDTIEKRVQQAEDHGLDAIAITDHDKISNELESRSFTAENGVEVITGTEIKCEIDGIKIEVLGYFVDPNSSSMNILFDRLSKNRVKRMEKMVENLQSEIDKEIDVDNILDREDRTPGRPHLAAELVELGVVDSHQEAFEQLIGSDSEAYEEVPKIPAEEVIHAIHESGGVAVLAHPGRNLKKENAVEKIGKLVRKDLDGLEVEYTYRQKMQLPSYKVFFTEVYANKMAELYDLIPTGGSDCHGSGSDKFNIGKVKTDYETVTRLKALSKEYR